MARTEIPFVVQRASGDIIEDAQAQVYYRNADGSNGSVAPVFSNDTEGVASRPNPQLTIGGRIEGWLDPGRYNISITGTGLSPYIQPWDVIPSESPTFTGTVTIPGLNVSGLFAHKGTTLGFYNVTPVTRSATYTITNVTTDRAYDANVTTMDELADVLGTLISDLKATGIIG